MEKEFDLNNELSDKIALVARGTKGTGKTIGERLRQAGAKVIITEPKALRDVSKKLHFIAADLSRLIKPPAPSCSWIMTSSSEPMMESISDSSNIWNKQATQKVTCFST